MLTASALTKTAAAALSVPVLLFSLTACSDKFAPQQGVRQASPVQTPIAGSEVKLLLTPQALPADPEAAFRTVWQDVKTVFERHGITVTEKAKKPFKVSVSAKSFWDTADSALWEQGYLIRTSVSFKKGLAADTMKVTVKRINRPDAVVLNSPLRTSDGRAGVTEANFGAGPDGQLMRYLEKSLTYRTAAVPPETSVPLAVFARQVPALAGAGRSAETKLTPHTVSALSVKPGAAAVPGMAAPCELTLERWSSPADGAPLVMDFSVHTEGDPEQHPEAVARLEKAMAELSQRAGETYGLPAADRYLGSKVRFFLQKPAQ